MHTKCLIVHVVVRAAYIPRRIRHDAYILTSVYMSPTYQPKCWSRTHVWVITCVCKYIYSHSISLHAQMHVQFVCIKSCMNVHIYTCTRTELHANIMRGTYLRSMLNTYRDSQPSQLATGTYIESYPWHPCVCRYAETGRPTLVIRLSI